jgi:hypothetical protein
MYRRLADPHFSGNSRKAFSGSVHLEHLATVALHAWSSANSSK